MVNATRPVPDRTSAYPGVTGILGPGGDPPFSLRGHLLASCVPLGPTTRHLLPELKFLQDKRKAFAG